MIHSVIKLYFIFLILLIDIKNISDILIKIVNIQYDYTTRQQKKVITK